MKKIWVQGNSEMYFCVCPLLQVSILVEFKSNLFYAYPVWSYNSYLIDLRYPSSVSTNFCVSSALVSRNATGEKDDSVQLQNLPWVPLKFFFTHHPFHQVSHLLSAVARIQATFSFYHLFLVVLFLLHGSICNQLFSLFVAFAAKVKSFAFER